MNSVKPKNLAAPSKTPAVAVSGSSDHQGAETAMRVGVSGEQFEALPNGLLQCHSCCREYDIQPDEKPQSVTDACPADDCPSHWEERGIPNPEFPDEEPVRTAVGLLSMVRADTPLPPGSLLVLRTTALDDDDGRNRCTLAGELWEVHGRGKDELDLVAPATGGWVKMTREELCQEACLFRPDPGVSVGALMLTGLPGVSAELRKDASENDDERRSAACLYAVREALAAGRRHYPTIYSYLESDDAAAGSFQVVVTFEAAKVEHRLNAVRDFDLDGGYCTRAYRVDENDEPARVEDQVRADLDTVFPRQWVVKDGHGRPEIVCADLLRAAKDILGDSAVVSRLQQDLISTDFDDESGYVDIQERAIEHLATNGYDARFEPGAIVIERAKAKHPALHIPENGGDPKTVLTHYVHGVPEVAESELGKRLRRDMSDLWNVNGGLAPAMPEYIPLLRDIMAHPHIAGTPAEAQIQGTLDSYLPGGRVLGGGHSVLFPYADHFEDVVEQILPWDSGSKMKAREDGAQGRLGDPSHPKEEDAVIGTFLTQTGMRACGNIRLKPEVIDALREQMLNVEYDTISFSLHHHKESGRSLLVAKYGQIIGSHYLAYFDTESVPGWLTSKE